jgi:hypothetical protein
MCARGKTKTAYGYIWRFADDLVNNELDSTKILEELK